MIRVVLVDDQVLVRAGLRALLDSEDDIEVVGEAGTAGMALAGIAKQRPDVAVLDVRLPDGNGVEVCREVRARDPQIACLMLTSFGDDEALYLERGDDVPPFESPAYGPRRAEFGE